MTITIIILAVFAILVIWGIGLQRKLVSAEELCKNSMSQIGVQQNSRWDALTSLAELVKATTSTSINHYGSNRPAQRDNSSSSAAEAQVQEDALSKAFGQIKLVVERYPELKANQQYLKTMDSVNTYENQVRLARMTYNDTVTKFNRMVRQFPDSIIAGLLRFTTKTIWPSLRERPTCHP